MHEAIEDAEDQRRQLSAAKKKAQRLAAEMQDTKLHLEEQMSRNNDLERKQRRWASTNFVTTLYSIYIHFISQQFLKILNDIEIKWIMLLQYCVLLAKLYSNIYKLSADIEIFFGTWSKVSVWIVEK